MVSGELTCILTVADGCLVNEIGVACDLTDDTCNAACLTLSCGEIGNVKAVLDCEGSLAVDVTYDTADVALNARECALVNAVIDGEVEVC